MCHCSACVPCLFASSVLLAHVLLWCVRAVLPQRAVARAAFVRVCGADFGFSYAALRCEVRLAASDLFIAAGWVAMRWHVGRMGLPFFPLRRVCALVRVAFCERPGVHVGGEGSESRHVGVFGDSRVRPAFLQTC